MAKLYGPLLPRGEEQSTLASGLAAYLQQESIPLDLTLEITRSCNLRCRHCYNFDRSQCLPPDNKDVALAHQEILSIIKMAEEERSLNITFTGGEPLLNPHVCDYVGIVRQKHMGAHLKTNGTLITPELAEELKHNRLMSLEISLYGSSDITHDTMTRVPGSFQKALEGAQNAIKAGLKPRWVFTLTNKNAPEVQAMIALAEDMGMPYGFNTQISARYDSSRSSLDYRLTRSQLKTLYSGVLKDHLPTPDFDPKASVQCGCARGICGISATGDIYPCIGAPMVAGNIRHTPLREVWNNSGVFKNIRSLKLEDFETCKPCPHRPYCRRSSGYVYVNTGNYTGPEEWTCMEAEVIHEVFEENNKL